MIFIPKSFRCKVVFVVESCNNSGLFRDVLGVWSQMTLLEQSVLTRQGALEQRIAEVDAHVAQIAAVERQLSGKVKRWGSICQTLKQQTVRAQAALKPAIVEAVSEPAEPEAVSEPAEPASRPVGKYFL